MIVPFKTTLNTTRLLQQDLSEIVVFSVLFMSRHFTANGSKHLSIYATLCETGWQLYLLYMLSTYTSFSLYYQQMMRKTFFNMPKYFCEYQIRCRWFFRDGIHALLLTKLSTMDDRVWRKSHFWRRIHSLQISPEGDRVNALNTAKYNRPSIADGFPMTSRWGRLIQPSRRKKHHTSSRSSQKVTFEEQ